MDFGACMFFTDYSMSPAELGTALEERGFESVWAPEHSHIPTSRLSPYPGGGELPKPYYDALDPFVSLTQAAAVTKRLKVGTGVCLVIQRDTIQTAKEVASLDLLSGGRFLFGVGGGWNAEEMADHGTAFKTRFKLMRERIEAMKEIWTKKEAEYHGEFVNFPPMFAWPKPVQKPHPPIIVGGAFPKAAERAVRYGDGWIPLARGDLAQQLAEQFAEFRRMAQAAGRDPASLSLSGFAVPDNPDLLRRMGDAGMSRAIFVLPSAKADKVLPALDHWAGVMRKTA
jgi:probable F420-dependent oxidoreductase